MTPAATLTAPSSDGTLGFDEVAASGQTIAALSFDTQNLAVQTAVYAFGMPAGGWSSSEVPAQLTAATGQRLAPVAASDDTVVAGDASTRDAGSITAFVFARPSNGWSGSLNQAATLTAPSNGSVTRIGPNVAISGPTVFTSNGNAIYAFDEPSGGWSGTEGPSATLSASNGAAFDAIAVSGNTVVATSATAVYVFTEPSGGWSGDLRETTSVPLPGPGPVESSVAISGNTIVAAGGLNGSNENAYIIQESPSGWSATHSPSATLSYPYSAGELGPEVSISGNTVALGTANPLEHECPCIDSLYAVSQQGSSWTGTTTIQPTASLASSDSSPISINGQTLAAGAADGVHVYTASQASTVSNVTLRKLTTLKPQLTLKASAVAPGQQIKSLTLQLPPQLKLKNSRRARVRVSVASQTKIKRHTLMVTLIKPAPKVSITIRDGAMTKSSALSKALRKVSHSHGHKNKRGISVNLSALLLDADGTTTTANISFVIK